MYQAAIRVIIRALNVRILIVILGVAYQCLLIETANMLIMTYAYARASGDGSFISKYVRIHTIFSPRGTDGLLIV